MIKVSEETASYGNSIKRILRGSLISILLTVILLIGFSCVLTYTSITENTIPIGVIIIAGVSILIGSQISTVSTKKNGILTGGSIGLIYILALYIISSIIGGNFTLNMYSIIMIVISMVMGAVGGIIGVNMNRK